jgi:ribosomal protein S9
MVWCRGNESSDEREQVRDLVAEVSGGGRKGRGDGEGRGIDRGLWSFEGIRTTGDDDRARKEVEERPIDRKERPRVRRDGRRERRRTGRRSEGRSQQSCQISRGHMSKGVSVSL